jgi:hypothetical protein
MSDRRNESRVQEPAAWRSRWAARENQRRLSEHTAANRRWQADLHDLDQMLGVARSFEGLSAHPGSPLVLKRGERVFLALPMVTLIEGTTSPVRLSMDARFSWRGTRTTGRDNLQSAPPTAPEGMRAVDSGPVTLTDRRIVFHGSKHAREWAFSKLLGLANSQAGPYTVLQVSNRQKPSGVLYPPSAAPGWRFNLALALAVFADRRQTLVADLERERHELIALRPGVPAVALPEQAPSQLALIHAVSTLYVGRPGQSAARRIVQGTVAGVVTLFALSIVAGLSSTTVSTTSAGLALPTARPSSSSPTRKPAATVAPPTAAVTSTASRPASPRPGVKNPAQRPQVTATRSTPRPTTRPTTRATPKPTPRPAAPKLCGAPANPWGYTFCGGAYITSPPSDFCAYFDCIANFPKGHGYVEQCMDGRFSRSGGRQGACSYHRGERRPLFN